MKIDYFYNKIFYQAYGKPTDYNTPGSRIQDAYWLMSSLGGSNLLAVANYIKFFTGINLSDYVPTAVWVSLLFGFALVFNYYYMMKGKRYKRVFKKFEEEDGGKKSNRLILGYALFTIIFVPLSGFVNIAD